MADPNNPYGYGGMFGLSDPAVADWLNSNLTRQNLPGMAATMDANTGNTQALAKAAMDYYHGSVARAAAPPPSLAQFFPQSAAQIAAPFSMAPPMARVIASPATSLLSGASVSLQNVLAHLHAALTGNQQGATQ